MNKQQATSNEQRATSLTLREAGEAACQQVHIGQHHLLAFCMLLERFREHLEAEAEAGVVEIETTAGLLLYDLAEFLGLGEWEKARLFGQPGYTDLGIALDMPVGVGDGEPKR